MRSRLRSLLLTLILFSFIACTKEMSKEAGNTTGTGAGDFYATIRGNLWNADSLQLILVSTDGVSINGLSRTGDQVSILLPAFKVGTYTLNAQSASYALYANILNNAANVYVSNAGTAGGIRSEPHGSDCYHSVGGATPSRSPSLTSSAPPSRSVRQASDRSGTG